MAVDGPARRDYAHNDPPKGEDANPKFNNGDGKAGYDKNQKNIDNLTHTPDGKPVKPGDGQDRIDSKGYVYSWDQDANGGKGAYGVSGKVSEEDMKKAKAGDDLSDKVKWYDDKDYEKASGITNDGGTDGYDANADKI